MQLTLFRAVAEGRKTIDPPTGQELKTDIMVRLDITCEGWLSRARATARTLCRMYGQITIEDVTTAMVDDPAPHPNAKGAVFKGNEWQSCGLKAATHAEAHGRRVFVWQMKTPA